MRKKLETKEKEKNKDDLLKSGKKLSVEESNNNTFKNSKKKPRRIGKNSFQKIGMKESENGLKDSLVKNERKGEDYLEVKNDLSRSIILEDKASKYRISKRHLANKERIVLIIKIKLSINLMLRILIFLSLKN